MTSVEHRLFEQAWPEGEYRFFQLGFIVDDVLATAATWARVFGVGPFHVLPPIEQTCSYRGIESGFNVSVAVAQAGPVQIELIQQNCDRPSVYRELAMDGASGFHQLCTVTRDFDGAKEHYANLGYELACELTAADGQRVAYIDTMADFGFFTEIVAETPTFLGLLANISRTCADWDGTDPVRLLTRDGYRLPEHHG
jgi:hypothetical protein